MNNCVFARSRNAHRLYVWQNGVFLFWMDAKKRWARSDFVQHLYDEAYCKDPDVTPEEWFVDSSDFTILDEYEVPADALAALQEVTLCKNVPTADAAATTATPAAGAKAATSTTPAAVKSCPKAPTSPAGTSAAMSSLSDAETSCSAPAFDYSGLDEQTVNDLHLAAIYGISEEENFKGRRFSIFVHAAFGQVNIAECFNIDTDGFHTLHLEKTARHKAPPPLFTTTCSGRIPSACDDILLPVLPGAGPFLHPAGLF